MFNSQTLRRLASAFGAGLFTAMSLPPWGWWPLLFVGVAWFGLLTSEHGVSTRSNVMVAAVWATAWLAPATWWMKSLSVPGYVLAVLAFAGFHALAALATTIATYSDTASGAHPHLKLLVQATTHTLAEALRFSFPFGGVPLASFGIALAGSPFLYLARIGGVLGLTFFAFVVGFALARIANWPTFTRIALLAVVLLSAVILPRLADRANPIGKVRIAVVQGGGPQGTHAIDSDPELVLQRHLDMTATIEVDDTVDLVLWPENVVDVNTFITSSAYTRIVSEAKRLNVPFLVGITEDVDNKNFTNAQVVVLPNGTVSDRYDKVRRVPFGEYMPLRGLLDALGAPVDLVPRDAIAGTGPAVLSTTVGKFAVVISWEIFFGGRVNEGVEHGGSIVINPTNGSSYTGTILQTQQVASSRLRAVESDRWVVQAAPTGFSAFVSPDGDVHQRTMVGEGTVLIRTIDQRSGRTIYSRMGDAPIIISLLLLLAFTVYSCRFRPHSK